MTDTHDAHGWEYASVTTLIAKPKVADEISIHIQEEEYKIPAIEHELDHNPLGALFAVVVKLNERVNELESILKENNDDLRL